MLTRTHTAIAIGLGAAGLIWSAAPFSAEATKLQKSLPSASGYVSPKSEARPNKSDRYKNTLRHPRNGHRYWHLR